VEGNEILSPANDGGNKGGEIEAKDKIEYDIPLRHAEVMPQFPGGMEAFLKFMQRNLKQPEDFDEGQKMVVLASFVVDAGGNIVNIAIDQKARPDLDAEVLRVLKCLFGNPVCKMEEKCRCFTSCRLHLLPVIKNYFLNCPGRHNNLN